MSEQRKRMEDVSVLAAYDANHPEERPYGLTLKADHIQAREDRRQLVDLARAFMFEGRNVVTLRWAKKLLAEVDPQ